MSSVSFTYPFKAEMPLDVTTHQEALPYSPFTTTTKGVFLKTHVNEQNQGFANEFRVVRKYFVLFFLKELSAKRHCLTAFLNRGKDTLFNIEKQTFFAACEKIFVVWRIIFRRMA
jgi:hypothetical protein